LCSSDLVAQLPLAQANNLQLQLLPEPLPAFRIQKALWVAAAADSDADARWRERWCVLASPSARRLFGSLQPLTGSLTRDGGRGGASWPAPVREGSLGRCSPTGSLTRDGGRGGAYWPAPVLEGSYTARGS
jgi:hypothetical protein